ncbi:phosphatidate cytidylyltransferase, mitochondrial isoform X2 [Elephas maximus indicus]|uniref:phosphatidate cytidylyltransferase, mitochondrial isoform X2 n=1 Tax=Elephas maximus indicus TaxID=99487 RepID=UPI0021171C5C|nr:phosphatidate cytidylyltransferase, mitochondrial isoform X2 [Elephas maximus indicus]
MVLQSLPRSGVAFRKILSHFPEELSLAFAYGSGVYRQAGPNANQKNPMLDLVFTVDDPVGWHSKNLKKNWSHYSFLKVLGPRTITTVQNNFGAGVYYNPLIKCDGRLIKYGVISTSILIEDLLTWNNLYIAGRLQKPVKIVAMNENATLRAALDKNLKSAVNAAFLLLPESFSEEELFIEIAGLSYSVHCILPGILKACEQPSKAQQLVSICLEQQRRVRKRRRIWNVWLIESMNNCLLCHGTRRIGWCPATTTEHFDKRFCRRILIKRGDFRMMVGEDKSKVLNIVKPNVVHFRELYGTILQENPQVVYKIQQGRLELDKSPEGQFTQLMALPKTLQQRINHIMDPPGKNRDVEETLFQLANDPDCSEVVRLGMKKSVIYSSLKLHKMWRGWLRKT